MIKPPYDAESFPADYLSYIQSLTGDRELAMTQLFSEPKDPAMALGRQGDENFRDSVLAGYRKDGLFVVLKFAPKQAYAPKTWQYCIVRGAEWDVALEFPTFAAMLEHLEAERSPI